MWLDTFRSASKAVLVAGEYSANALVGLVDPRLRTSGATIEEGRVRLAGDALLPWVSWQDTRAVTIEGLVSEVWPWLAQAGYGRGGWYADMPWWRDAEGRRGRRSSAERLLPEEQHIAVGQVLLDGPGCDETTGAWTVRICEPERILVLFSSRTLSGHEVDPDGAPPWFYIDCSWAFALRAVPAGTRFVVRTRVKLNPDNRAARWLASALGFGDRAMQRAMLLGIKRRVEGTRPTRSGPGGGHNTGEVEEMRKKSLLVAAALVVGALVLSACAAGPNPESGAGANPAGFWQGLWQGLILPITFIVSLFTDTVNIYEVRNDGNWYDFGYVLGLMFVFSSGGAGAGSRRR